MTRAQIETLAVMRHDTAYSSAVVAHRRWDKYGRGCTTNQQFAVFKRMKADGLVERVPDRSGDMWARLK